MVIGCSLILSLVFLTGIIGHRAFRKISEETQLNRQVRQCNLLFQAIKDADVKIALRFDWGDTRYEYASNDWKTAKDKFLAEVKRLAQSPMLGNKERAIVDSIQDAWKGYEVSFNRRILADNDAKKLSEAQRIQLETTLQELSRTTHASLEQEIVGADRAIVLLVIFAGLLCMICFLRIFQQILLARQERHHRGLSESSDLNGLKAQADKLKNSLDELRAILSEVISPKASEKTEDTSNTETQRTDK
jgi:hypothetical protein